MIRIIWSGIDDADNADQVFSKTCISKDKSVLITEINYPFKSHLPVSTHYSSNEDAARRINSRHWKYFLVYDTDTDTLY